MRGGGGSQMNRRSRSYNEIALKPSNLVFLGILTCVGCTSSEEIFDACITLCDSKVNGCALYTGSNTCVSECEEGKAWIDSISNPDTSSSFTCDSIDRGKLLAAYECQAESTYACTAGCDAFFCEAERDAFMCAGLRSEVPSGCYPWLSLRPE